MNRSFRSSTTRPEKKTCCRQIAQQIDPGLWTERTGHDIPDLPRQTCGNNCGVFMLMYALSTVTRQGFDFRQMDMPLIRECWCLLLMERFKIEGHGQRFAFWTTEAISLIKGDLPPVFRVPRQSRLTTQVPPDIQAVSGRTEAEKALVDFIVHSQGAEQHLMSILGGKPSKWPMVKQVPVYLDSEEEQKTLFTHLKSLLDQSQANVKYTDEVQFICEVLFPEAIIYGISALNDISWEEAEQVFLAGSPLDQSEVDEFCRRLGRQMRKEGALP